MVNEYSVPEFWTRHTPTKKRLITFETKTPITISQEQVYSEDLSSMPNPLKNDPIVACILFPVLH